MENKQTFQEKLLSEQSGSSAGSEAYQRVLQQITASSLSRSGRFLYAVIFVVSVAASLYFGSWLFKHVGEAMIATFIRTMGSFGVFFSGFIAFIAGWSALTGKVRGRFTPGLIVSWTLIVLGYYAAALFYLQFIAPITIELLNAGDQGNISMIPVLGTHFMLLFFFAVTAVALMCLLRLLSDVKFQNQKKLLEIEYKLCDILQKIEKS